MKIPQVQSSMSLLTSQPIKSVPGRLTVNGKTEDILLEVYPSEYRFMTSLGEVSLRALTVIDFEDHIRDPECTLEFTMDFPTNVDGKLVDLQAEFQAYFPAEHWSFLWVKLTHGDRVIQDNDGAFECSYLKLHRHLFEGASESCFNCKWHLTNDFAGLQGLSCGLWMKEDPEALQWRRCWRKSWQRAELWKKSPPVRENFRCEAFEKGDNDTI